MILSPMAQAIEKLMRAAQADPTALVHGDAHNWVDIEFISAYDALEFAKLYDSQHQGSFHVQFMNTPHDLNHATVLTFTYTIGKDDL